MQLDNTIIHTAKVIYTKQQQQRLPFTLVYIHNTQVSMWVIIEMIGQGIIIDVNELWVQCDQCSCTI